MVHKWTAVFLLYPLMPEEVREMSEVKRVWDEKGVWGERGIWDFLIKALISFMRTLP